MNLKSKIKESAIQSLEYLKKTCPSRWIYALGALIALFAIMAPGENYHVQKWPMVGEGRGNDLFSKGATIQISAKAYTTEESKKFLQKNLLSAGYQPIQLTFQNNSPNAFSISPGSIDLPTVEPKAIASKVMYSAIPRSLAFKAASFLFWPFMIPDTLNTIHTMRSYSLLKRDLNSKSVKKEVIAPYSIFNRLVFVPSDKFQKSFDITLIDLETLQPITIHMSDLQKGYGNVVTKVENVNVYEVSFEEAKSERQAD